MNTTMSYCLKNLSEKSKLRAMNDYTQHGNTSCLEHTLAVAYYSVRVAEMLGLKLKKRDLIRGAVLHDYFLYDWHDGNGRGVHGFTHPKAALRNAERDFPLTATERDIIKKHMFPLTGIPPMHRESWIVCIVDKACSVYETVRRDKAYSAPYMQRKDICSAIFCAIKNM